MLSSNHAIKVIKAIAKITPGIAYPEIDNVDRVGVINQGEIIIVEQKKELLKKMGQKKLIVELQHELDLVPEKLKKYNLIIGSNKMSLNYTYNLREKQTGITNLLQDMKDSGLKLRDLKTEQSNLENIFVSLVRENNEN